MFSNARGLNIFSHTLKRNSTESLFWRVIGVIMLLLMHTVLASKLSLESYGLFSFTISITNILVLITTMGWPSALVRLVTQYTTAHQWSLLRGALVRSHRTSLGMTLFFSTIMIFISTAVPHDQRLEALYYSGLLLPFMSLIALRRRIFMGLHSIRGALIPDEVLLPSLVLAGLLIINNITLNNVVLLYALSMCGVFSLTLYWLWKILPPELTKAPSKFDSRTWRPMTFFLMIGGLTQIVLSQSGIFMLGLFDKFDDAALFGASFRLSLFVTFTMTAINVIGMPVLATAFHEKDTISLVNTYRITLGWSILGAVPPAIILLLFPTFLLALFGESFQQGSTILQILAMGQFANASAGLAGSYLVISGEQKFFANSMVIAAFSSVTLMLIIVPIWEGIGAAIVYSTCLTALSIAQFIKAIKSFKYLTT